MKIRIIVLAIVGTIIISLFMVRAINGSREMSAPPQCDETDAAILAKRVNKGCFIKRVSKAQVLVALQDIRAKFPEVERIHIYHRAEGLMGDGDRIELAWDKDVWQFTFIHAWGDCPSGCICGRSFSFSYRPDTKTAIKTGQRTWGDFPEERS
jgi:hypothetical protein